MLTLSRLPACSPGREAHTGDFSSCVTLNLWARFVQDPLVPPRSSSSSSKKKKKSKDRFLLWGLSNQDYVSQTRRGRRRPLREPSPSLLQARTLNPGITLLSPNLEVGAGGGVLPQPSAEGAAAGGGGGRGGGRVSGEDKVSVVGIARGRHPSRTMWVYRRPLPSAAQDRGPRPRPQAQALGGMWPPPAAISLGALPVRECG